MAKPLADMRPLVAILRGVNPDEVVGIGQSLLDAGFEIIEVPLNSPQPLQSIQMLCDAFGDHAIIGAGTVLSDGEVEAVCEAGGKLIVSPNMNRSVIERTKELGALSYPGVFTPTEAFDAIAAGADALKFFPASMHGPGGIKAIKAVLPPDMPVLAVGGVDECTIGTWIEAGADGFGIGSNVYTPGMTAQEVGAKAKAFVTAFDAVSG